ncbi:IS1634 family transposase [Clostridium bowmanii]|uniref:IS1634 family transposase n=1 Tax=Clostridium bowmanii TaxID=132925 RepID=UPI001C0B50BB|nr:IS1634 family transposase [Clostridium bowmanii]MBU3188347.1 IS1634 family transposase [Clostridium bowmanii]MCA1072735.1 IS1634 family transposase [Clostridium bowmanii]
MDMNDMLSIDMEMYYDCKMNFMVGLCEQLKLSEVFNLNLEKSLGRKTDIPYGIMAEMMIVNICDDHHPLYLLNEYYKEKDLEGIFHCPIDLSQINDDRFGKFLDAFYEAGPRKIFGELSAQAFANYGIKVVNINYDTTSKVMWGTYETEELKQGVISIDFGHSKQKRQDKKQIKMGIGVANGVIVDAKVLSGNKDDKTYNNETLEDVEGVLRRLNISTEDFHYIADSALFTARNLKKAESRNIKLITRMPETTTLAKECIREALDRRSKMSEIEIQTSQGKASKYYVIEQDCTYEGTKLKCAVCYSVNLENIKERTIAKQVIKEKEVLRKLSKTYLKTAFACEEDANKEILRLLKRDLKKVKYHNVSMQILVTEKKKKGRQPKDISKVEHIMEHFLQIEINEDKEKIQKNFEQACTFILCSNDLTLKAEDLLREYKTQIGVEKKFQQLKSPHFVNSLYLETPERIEALTYLILISMMILSVAEHVVRREMKAEGAIIMLNVKL